jgi:hypothetical protein
MGSLVSVDIASERVKEINEKMSPAGMDELQPAGWLQGEPKARRRLAPSQ